LYDVALKLIVAKQTRWDLPPARARGGIEALESELAADRGDAGHARRQNAWVLRYAQDDNLRDGNLEGDDPRDENRGIEGYWASMKVTVTWVRMGTFWPSTVKGL
jgi:hypothetical protein